MRVSRQVQPDPVTHVELVGLLTRFCSGFAARDAKAVIATLAPDSDPVVVTSEEALLRGHTELRLFLERYIAGPTTYSWEWERHDSRVRGPVAWLLATGIESAQVGDRVEQHPYRMTIVAERTSEGWLLTHVHGSSPH
jgi:ketosteroid isomerase-like protein